MAATLETECSILIDNISIEDYKKMKYTLDQRGRATKRTKIVSPKTDYRLYAQQNQTFLDTFGITASEDWVIRSISEETLFQLQLKLFKEIKDVAIVYDNDILLIRHQRAVEYDLIGHPLMSAALERVTVLAQKHMVPCNPLTHHQFVYYPSAKFRIVLNTITGPSEKEKLQLLFEYEDDESSPEQLLLCIENALGRQFFLEILSGAADLSNLDPIEIVAQTPLNSSRRFTELPNKATKLNSIAFKARKLDGVRFKAIFMHNILYVFGKGFVTQFEGVFASPRPRAIYVMTMEMIENSFVVIDIPFMVQPVKSIGLKPAQWIPGILIPSDAKGDLHPRNEFIVFSIPVLKAIELMQTWSRLSSTLQIQTFYPIPRDGEVLDLASSNKTQWPTDGWLLFSDTIIFKYKEFHTIELEVNVQMLYALRGQKLNNLVIQWGDAPPNIKGVAEFRVDDKNTLTFLKMRKDKPFPDKLSKIYRILNNCTPTNREIFISPGQRPNPK